MYIKTCRDSWLRYLSPQSVEIPDYVIFLHKAFILFFVRPIDNGESILGCCPGNTQSTYGFSPRFQLKACCSGDQSQEDDMSHFCFIKTLESPPWFSKIFCLGFYISHPRIQQINVLRGESPFTWFLPFDGLHQKLCAVFPMFQQ